MPKRINILWLGLAVTLLSLIDLCLPHPNVYRCDPVTLTFLAISAASALAPYTQGWSMGLVGHLLYQKPKIPASIDRGKQDDVRISMPGYGESIVWARGIFRCAPTWFWHKPIVHSTVTTPGSSGGKGAPKPPTPGTIDHVYTTSVGGVFHDGEIKTVRRIWFGTDLVWNIVETSPTRYEAESATLAGGANVVSSSIASGGEKVTDIGNGGMVTFDVDISADGDYDVAIFYLDSTTTLAYEVLVDGVSQGTVSCEASGSGLMAIQTIGLTLTAGTRAIRFRNTAADCPDMDRIEVVDTLVLTTGNVDSRTFTDLIDPTILPPTDETKPWPFHNYLPIEIDPEDPGGGTITGTSTITASLAKYGQPQIRIYRGTADQTADPAIIADKGVDDTPAWRGLAYIVIEGIQLPNGALPNVTIEVDQGTSDVDTMVEDHYALGGVDSSNLELSALSGLTITGLMRTSQRPIGDSLKDLLTRFQFDLPEYDGVVNAVLRNRTSVDFTITAAKLRAHPSGTDIPDQDAVITDTDPLLFPYRFDVNFLNSGYDFHNDIQFDTRASGPQTDNQSVSLALVDTESNMKKLASVLLYRPDMEGRGFEFFAGPEFIKVVPGSIGTISLTNATHTVRVINAKYGLPAGVNQFQLVRHAPSLYGATGFGAPIVSETPVAGFPSNTRGIILDGPLFRPEDQGDGTQPVVYIAMCGIGGGAWPGGFLYQESPIGSGQYVFVTVSDKPSGIGVTDGTLSSVSDPSTWDRTSSLTFSLYYDPGLSSAAEADLLNNPNLNLLAVINPSTNEVECLQFKTATPLSPVSPFAARYSVSTFLRGRFMTEGNVGIHTSADDVVVIDSTLKPRRISIADIGR